MDRVNTQIINQINISSKYCLCVYIMDFMNLRLMLRVA